MNSSYGTRLLNIGFGNMVSTDRLTAIINADSAPVKRMIQEAREAGRLIDATCGRRTRAVIVTNSNQIVLSAIQPETIASRLNGKETFRVSDEAEEGGRQ